MGERSNATKKIYPEQIIGKLREAEVHLSQGKSAEEIARLLEISK